MSAVAQYKPPLPCGFVRRHAPLALADAFDDRRASMAIIGPHLRRLGCPRITTELVGWLYDVRALIAYKGGVIPVGEVLPASWLTRCLPARNALRRTKGARQKRMERYRRVAIKLGFFEAGRDWFAVTHAIVTMRPVVIDKFVDRAEQENHRLSSVKIAEKCESQNVIFGEFSPYISTCPLDGRMDKRKSRPLWGAHGRTQARNASGRFGKAATPTQPPTASGLPLSENQKEESLALPAMPAASVPQALREAPKDAQQRHMPTGCSAIDSLPPEDRALLSPAAVRTAKGLTKRFLLDGHIRVSLAEARARVEQGKPPFDPDPPPEPPRAAVRPPSAPAKPPAPPKPRVDPSDPTAPQWVTKLAIAEPAGDEREATQDWLNQNLGPIAETHDVPWRPEARAGYTRAVWRAAVGKLLAQIRSRIHKPGSFLAICARSIAAGNGGDARRGLYYTVQRGWPVELARFALVEKRMPGWEREFGGFHNPPEE